MMTDIDKDDHSFWGLQPPAKSRAEQIETKVATDHFEKESERWLDEGRIDQEEYDIYQEWIKEMRALWEQRYPHLSPLTQEMIDNYEPTYR
jgi:hypothetical protein